MGETKWEITTNRFVAFFDIMGFKDFVERNSHEAVVNRLYKLNEIIDQIKDMHMIGSLKDVNSAYDEDVNLNESKVVIFSDSVMIFSKDDSLESCNKILIDSSYLLYYAIQSQIPLKGVLSFGEVTLDFDNSLFFGRPVIDAYLLHDQLQMYAAIMDHHFEGKMSQLDLLKEFKEDVATEYKVSLKRGRIKHRVVHPPKDNVEAHIKDINSLYNTVSGPPRMYIDNTISFYEELAKVQGED